MFYKFSFNIELIKEKENYIYAEATNIDKIEFEDIKKGFFDNIILSLRDITNWPEVEFYYSSKVSNKESEYLLNVKRWPIIHIKVVEEFIKANIKGIEFLPIKLVDIVSGEENKNYYWS